MYAQAGLSLCWSHIPHCWKSHVTAHMIKCIYNILYMFLVRQSLLQKDGRNTRFCERKRKIFIHCSNRSFDPLIWLKSILSKVNIVRGEHPKKLSSTRNFWRKGFDKILTLLYRGSNILLDLVQELGKRDKMRGLLSILSLFRNEFYKFNNTRAWMLS